MNARRGMAALAMALAVAGCSESENRAGSLPQITSTPTVSPTPAPSVPPFPATDQGAEAFIRLWVQVLNAAGETGDTTTLKALSSGECLSCSGLVSYIERSWANGRLEGGGITLKELVAADVDETHANLTANFVFAPERRLDAQGRVIGQTPGGTEGELIRLVRFGAGWQLAALKELK